MSFDDDARADKGKGYGGSTMVTFGPDISVDVDAPEGVEGYPCPELPLALSCLIGTKVVSLGCNVLMIEDDADTEEVREGGRDEGCDGAIDNAGSCSEGKRADTSVSTIEYPTRLPGLLWPYSPCICPEEYRAEIDSRNGRAPSLVVFVTKRFRGNLRLSSFSSEQGYSMSMISSRPLAEKSGLG